MAFLEKKCTDVSQVAILEKKSIDLSSYQVDPFTQKPFNALVQESLGSNLTHVFVRVYLADNECILYDARSMCKQIFELVISSEGKFIRQKRKTDPSSDKEIKEMAFYETKDGIKGTLIGKTEDFIQSSEFRSRIFNRNDPFDSISINFMLKDQDKVKLKKKPLILLWISFAVLCAILISCTYTVMHSNSLIEPLKKHLK